MITDVHKKKVATAATGFIDSLTKTDTKEGNVVTNYLGSVVGSSQKTIPTILKNFKKSRAAKRNEPNIELEELESQESSVLTESDAEQLFEKRPFTATTVTNPISEVAESSIERSGPPK